MSHRVELLWFSECANRVAAREMLEDVVGRVAPGTPIKDVDASDPSVAAQVRFPGSPTIRIDGRDVDPSYVDSGDYTPRCRLYRTSAGLRGVPEPRWIEGALGQLCGLSRTLSGRADGGSHCRQTPANS
ncbi:MAG: hypothetical protein ABJC24_00540 [Chloroflexota bacterium]